jgi:signal peptidase I
MADSHRLKISGQNFSQLITSVVEKGASAKFKVTGKSMFPNIISGDIVTVASYQDRNPIIGDIIGLTNLERNQVIFHRIIKIIDEMFLIKGDNVFKNDGLFPRDCIVGYVCGIERKKKIISFSRMNNW